MLLAPNRYLMNPVCRSIRLLADASMSVKKKAALPS
jgi:hypothetical protein